MYISSWLIISTPSTLRRRRPPINEDHLLFRLQNKNKDWGESQYVSFYFPIKLSPTESELTHGIDTTTVRMVRMESYQHNFLFCFTLRQKVFVVHSNNWLFWPLHISWSDELSVCHNFPKGREVTLPCSYRNTFLAAAAVIQGEKSVYVKPGSSISLRLV